MEKQFCIIKVRMEVTTNKNLEYKEISVQKSQKI